ncbi:hypothetical protein [Ignatzschineria cameli]|uniref:Tripartite tricarboxylate transporter TctB family protein n=1 Tax=Ignatzschineria cameli TaxID=2182793 RepID=A0ABX5L2J1_9GAMM|nr:hypothetical protein [Ignatzschineria cameli]PWD88986.1 hypothetical protein DC079_07785 [Ignatzschineria cameli]PWD90134.1 hypothetical protein DC081_08095 [Ignatzschineria cameli]PWD90797.1 hypothetical protein DC078_08005 [Ignatzschineria cameli]
MTVLIVLGVILGILLFMGAIYLFNQHCEDEFGYQFLTLGATGFLGIGAAIFYGGLKWYQSSLTGTGSEFLGLEVNRETLNGLVVMGIGLLMYLLTAVVNYKETDWLYGTIGTALQFTLLPLFAYLGIYLMILYFFIMISLGLITNMFSSS